MALFVAVGCIIDIGFSVKGACTPQVAMVQTSGHFSSSVPSLAKPWQLSDCELATSLHLRSLVSKVGL